LHLAGLDAHILHAIAGLEGFFKLRASAQIANLGADDGVAAPWFMVMILDDAQKLPVQLKRDSLAEVVDINHDYCFSL
jgi:hypothetical protein